jgi:hypothetical protein
MNARNGIQDNNTIVIVIITNIMRNSIPIMNDIISQMTIIEKFIYDAIKSNMFIIMCNTGLISIYTKIIQHTKITMQVLNRTFFAHIM